MNVTCSRCKTQKCKVGCLNYVAVPDIQITRKALNERVQEVMFQIVPNFGSVKMRGEGYLKMSEWLDTKLTEVFTRFMNKNMRFMISFGVGLVNKDKVEFENGMGIENVDIMSSTRRVGLNSIVQQVKKKIFDRIWNHEYEKSGVSVENITYIIFKTMEIGLIKAGRSYIELPKEIKNKKCCINIKNYDNKCFLWCIIAHFVLAEKKISNPSKISNYNKQEYIRKWDLSDIIFPVKISDIHIFEMQNDVSVNVYLYNDDLNLIYPKKARDCNVRHVNLLLYKEHYCLVKNLSRLFSTGGGNKSYVCVGCGVAVFSSAIALDKHIVNCGKGNYKLPYKFDLSFKNYQNAIEVPFIIYADFESYFEYLSNNNELNTNKIVYNKIHKPLAFCFKTICRSDDNLNNMEIYIGEKADMKFAEELYNEATRIEEILDDKIEMMDIDYEDYDNAKICYLCNKPFGDDLNYRKVKDHDHVNGIYRGAAHSICNLQYTKLNYTIPVVFHNLEGYDIHLFIESLSKYTKKYNIIPKSKEKYLSMEVELVGLKVKLKFIDSLHFITGSLEQNAKRLSNYKYTISEELREKQVFPYSYLTVSKNKSIEYILNEKRLPIEREDWINDLTKEETCEDDVKHAHYIFDKFGCKSIRDYTLLYLKTDVILLTEVFENFRDVSLKTYKLDPAWYYTTPGFAWVSCFLNFRTQL